MFGFSYCLSRTKTFSTLLGWLASTFTFTSYFFLLTGFSLSDLFRHFKCNITGDLPLKSESNGEHYDRYSISNATTVAIY